MPVHAASVAPRHSTHLHKAPVDQPLTSLPAHLALIHLRCSVALGPVIQVCGKGSAEVA